MTTIRSICLFCGASAGIDAAHSEAAAQFGARLAERGVRLVFGGGHVGLMGAAADGALAAGGEVVGVIPEHLRRRELGHEGITELHVVDTMHERKNLMFELADAFAVLPGGVGTLDEMFEVVTWKQLGLHDKPILLIDHNGYWEPLTALIRSIIESGFARSGTADLITVAHSVDEMFRILDRLPAPAVPGDTSKL